MAEALGLQARSDGSAEVRDLLGSRRESLASKCRYVYAEFYLSPVPEGVSFAEHVRKRLQGRGCDWCLCWDAVERGVEADSWSSPLGPRRILLIRFEIARSVVEAEWAACVGLPLADVVCELESWAFGRGHAGEFVRERVERIERRGARPGFAVEGAVQCSERLLLTRVGEIPTRGCVAWSACLGMQWLTMS